MSARLPFKRNLINEDRASIASLSPSIHTSETISTPTIKPGWVEVTQLILALPRLDPEFHGYRLVQISDIHMDGWMTAERISQVVDLVNQQEPDLIVVTGDFVTHKAVLYAPSLVPLLKRLSAREGVLAIRGNHDHWAGGPAVDQIIQDSGMVNLCNTAITLRRGAASLHFAGIDDYYVHADRLDLALKKVPSGGAAILLAHEPDFADISARTGRFDLQISGHTHGGQIDLPFIGRLFLPKYARKYPCGLYRPGGMWLYTNRGLGMTHFHIRYNAKSEITVYTLESGLLAGG
jgi:predicted MPP superfamily phosphohydrolase